MRRKTELREGERGREGKMRKKEMDGWMGKKREGAMMRIGIG
jgi:hypothetical protein